VPDYNFNTQRLRNCRLTPCIPGEANIVPDGSPPPFRIARTMGVSA